MMISRGGGGGEGGRRRGERLWRKKQKGSKEHGHRMDR